MLQTRVYTEEEQEIIDLFGSEENAKSFLNEHFKQWEQQRELEKQNKRITIIDRIKNLLTLALYLTFLYMLFNGFIFPMIELF